MTTHRIDFISADMDKPDKQVTEKRATNYFHSLKLAKDFLSRNLYSQILTHSCYQYVFAGKIYNDLYPKLYALVSPDGMKKGLLLSQVAHIRHDTAFRVLDILDNISHKLEVTEEIG
jgi:hypothetical protein